MTGRIRIAVLLMAAAAWLVAESQSDAGHRRRGHCGGCYTACAPAACTTGCAPAGGGCYTAVPATEAAPAPPAPPASPSDAAPAPPAPAPDAGAWVAPQQAGGYYTGRTARRGWLRR